ncbi:MAG: hypothetical protein GY716_15380 [bacterium]|nr:hypothetical protein [bacterium]
MDDPANDGTRRTRSVRLRAGLVLMLVAIWTVPALLLASQIHFMYLEEGRPLSWWSLFGWQLVGWLFWVPATLLVLRLCRRFPVSRNSWARVALVHSGTALVLTALNFVFLVWETWTLGPPPFNEYGFLPLTLAWVSQRLHLNFIIYAGMGGVGYGLEFYRRYRERELHASRLEGQLAQAQLQALKMQLHPHFLFNTLHAIAVLVRKNSNREAVRMLVGLSDLLRLALDNAGAQEVPLKQELDFLERYLDVEQIRFQDRLRVELDVAPETLDTSVPNLILQPLVENAIRHGIAPTADAGLVRIRAERRDGRLRVEISDDGPGLDAAAESGDREGVGLSNTRKRLQRLYGEDHRFSVGNSESGGAIAVLEIPFRPAHV